MLPLLLLLPAAVAAAHQIGKAFARADKQAIDRALADFIFAEGLPLRTVQSPFLRQFIQAVQKAPAPYTPPAYNTLRTSLLDDAKKRVTESLRPWEQRLQETGGTLCSDGWSEGLFGEAEAHADAAVMPAHQWWSIYGADHPQLQKLAITLLSQVSSACSCERNWSSYDFIHNRRRNRLTPARARDLVFVFTNGRLVRKMAVGEEGFIGWDEEEEMEGSGSEGEGEEGEEGEEGGSCEVEG